MIVGGEVRTNAYVEIPDLVRRSNRKIGYTKAEYMFESKSCGILSAIHAQSAYINRGVDHRQKSKVKYDNIGAGDKA